MTERKFYKTVFEVTVFTEGPYEPEQIEDIVWDIDKEGICTGQIERVGAFELDGQGILKEFDAIGFHPNLLGLDKEGNDVDEEEDEEEGPAGG